MTNPLAEPTTLEKANLEVHVDLCTLRYQNLDDRLTKIEKKVETIHEDIIEGQKSLSKVIIGTGGTMIAGVISIILTMILRSGTI